MKLVVFTLIAGNLLAFSAVAQQTTREQAVAQCIVRAQQQAPSSGDPNDPAFNARYNIYANCMRDQGQTP